MADAEQQQFGSLAERIAALNRQKSFHTIGAAGVEGPRQHRNPPPLPVRPSRTQTAPAVSASSPSHQTAPQPPPRSDGPTNGGSPALPRRDTQQEQGRPVPPPLPSRAATLQPSPALPPRKTPARPADAPSNRRNSASSDASMRSSVSSLSIARTASSTPSLASNATTQRKLPPPVFDVASLPPLPPTKREREAMAKEAAAQEVAAKQAARPAKPTRPSLPPRLPSRPAKPQNAALPRQARKIIGFDTQSAEQGVAPSVPADDAPPPVPVASRPSAAQMQALSTRHAAASQTQTGCWACRDWGGPDGVAAQFPRETVPRHGAVEYLARMLCDPFPSYMDKARAIFTWCHHNIAYDTNAFFSGKIGDQGPERTISSGLAVCAGYAETFKAIATRAGLECAVVTGHGKGFGHQPLKKGERPPPPKPDGHAWNAVRVDGGEWKLVDACWGAGHIDGASRLYQKEFHPAEFETPNDLFGRKHFPAESRFQLRSDGRVMSWEEYCAGPMDGEPVQVFSGWRGEGIAEHSIRPMERHISVHGGQVVRFQFSKVCEHWTSETHGLGKAPLFLLHTGGVGGQNKDMVPMETDGYWHWLDVDARDLGTPGQAVHVVQLTSFDGREGRDVRGVSRQEFLAGYGRVGMGWSCLMKWELV